MEQYSAEEARRAWRRILNDVERGEMTGVQRYNKPLAVVVPHAWYERAAAIMAHGLEDFALDMAAIRCPACMAEAYPGNVSEAVAWALNHECKEAPNAEHR